MPKMTAVEVAAVQVLEKDGHTPWRLGCRDGDQPFCAGMRAHGGTRHVEGGSHMPDGYTALRRRADSLPILCVTGPGAVRQAPPGELPGGR